MDKRGTSFALILDRVDLFYFAGTVQKGVLVVPVDGDVLFCVEKDLFRAREESPLDVIPIAKDKDVCDIMKAAKVLKGVGATELDVLPVGLYERWKSILGWESFVDISPAVRDLRIVKSPFEIDQLTAGGVILTRVFEKAREVIQEGKREVDIAADLEAFGRKCGHQGVLRVHGFNQEIPGINVTQGFGSTVASGADAPIAGIGTTHAIGMGPSLGTVRRGIPVLVDYGTGFNGYTTDETRAYAIGETGEMFRRGYDAAREILEDAMVFGREGVDATDLYARAEEILRKAGLEDHFMGYREGRVSFLGHGIGLEINELPVITGRHRTVLREGMVFALEPKFIFPGEGAVGIEADFIVRKEKLQRLTDSTLDIVYV